jgi:hypothetical protein
MPAPADRYAAKLRPILTATIASCDRRRSAAQIGRETEPEFGVCRQGPKHFAAARESFSRRLR